MAIRSPRYAFNAVNLAGAPQDQGVFTLWDGEELIYVGRATGRATIKSCLADHFAGDHGPCTRQATHYGWEITHFAAWREAELLEEFAALQRRLPRCQKT